MKKKHKSRRPSRKKPTPAAKGGRKTTAKQSGPAGKSAPLREVKVEKSTVKGKAREPDSSTARVVGLRPTRHSKSVRERTLLAPSALRWSCPPISSGSRKHGISTLLGQDRPIAAFRTGLALYAPGYNIFVTGMPGSGRTRLVTDLIRRLKPTGKLVEDRVFVSNFRQPNRPRLITLPRGEGPNFRDDMHELVHVLQETLGSVIRSRTHRVSHDLVLRSAEEREKRLMAALDRQAKKDGLSVVQFPGSGGGMMADIYPIYEGEAVNLEAFRDLVAQGQVSNTKYLRLRAKRDKLMDRLEEVTERLLRISHDTDEELRRMDRHVAIHVLRSHLRSFGRRWNHDEVTEFLDSLQEYILLDLDRWVTGDPRHDAEDHLPDDSTQPPPPEGLPQPPPPEGLPQPPYPTPPPAGRGEPVRFLGVEVHVIKTSDGDECPVVLETHPTYSNLFGVVEQSRDGHTPSLGQLHPGSILRSDGGYLILRLSELMSEPGVWTQLKRAVKVGRVEIREFDPNSGVTSGTLQPEAVPITLKVILIGDPGAYETLATEDSQFLQAFKIHAEFDTVMPATKGNMRRYADLVEWFRREEKLCPFNADANAAIVEYGARLAGRKDKLTARYGELADLAREASFICESSGAKIITRAHIEQAIQTRTYRVDLPRECVERDFKDGYLLMQSKGKTVGQINALTVLESDALIFGKPSRITAVTGAGPVNRSGVVNIERESDLSGPLHDKGVMILHGYLLRELASEEPLNLQATICFEQTYGGVDGDSASSAELCALLSSLTDIPIDQGFGVTGSINQLGVIQAVSGVNEKIEGFFRLCRSRGLTGTQGVILPVANVADMMLNPEVVAAVAAGKFSIHAVTHVDEMMELLTGVPMKKVRAVAVERVAQFRKMSG